MPLNLTITRAKSGGQRDSRTLGEGTLSIGRAAGNDWVLADPDQHLSRTHCMIAFESGHYWLTDLSTNGLFINGAREPTTRNSRVILTDGDTVLLGGYLLRVAEIEDGGFAAPPGGSRAAPRSDPFAAAGRGDGANPLNDDPFDDPFSQPAAVGFAHPMAHQPPSLRSADPFDLAEKPHRRVDIDDEDLFSGQTPLQSWTGPTPSDHVDAIAHAIPMPRAIPPVNIDEIDFDALLGDIMPTPAAHPLDPPKPVTAAPPQPLAADALDDLLGDFPPAHPPASLAAARLPSPPAVAAEPPSVARADATPAIATPAIATAANAAPANVEPAPALLAAFLEGAGLSQLDLKGADQEAAMRAVGALFRAFVGGTREVLMSRAQIKHEMRVEHTMIRPRDNNALKFSVSAEDAMVALLQPSRPGYKPPLDSVEEAFRDILSHEMAVMAGLQTGMIALLKRFDPAGLEGRLQRNMLDTILPGARKARFWELFCSSYQEIARDAEDDFQAVFGRDFARAYDEQVSKL